MNTLSAEQQRALDLLSELTEGAKGGMRRTEFLASTVSNPAWNERPEQWAVDWCAGWAFHLQPSLAESLDLRLVKRVRKASQAGGKTAAGGKSASAGTSESILEWTQGSAFAFREGYTIHDAPEAWTLPWSEALRFLKASLQVTQASPAVPAAGDKPRDPGRVVFRVYRPGKDGTRMEAAEERSATQDEFVRMLICGLPESMQGEGNAI